MDSSEATPDDSLILAAGAVVYCSNHGQTFLLLIQDKYRVWTLPKGHLDPGETEETAACREVAEETGIACTIGPLIQRVRYPVYKKGAWCDKQVAYFLACADYTAPTPRTDEGIGAACWFALKEALAMPGYAQVREVVRRALAML